MELLASFNIIIVLLFLTVNPPNTFHPDQPFLSAPSSTLTPFGGSDFLVWRYAFNLDFWDIIIFLLFNELSLLELGVLLGWMFTVSLLVEGLFFKSSAVILFWLESDFWTILFCITVPITVLFKNLLFTFPFWVFLHAWDPPTCKRWMHTLTSLPYFRVKLRKNSLPGVAKQLANFGSI